MPIPDFVSTKHFQTPNFWINFIYFIILFIKKQEKNKNTNTAAVHKKTQIIFDSFLFVDFLFKCEFRVYSYVNYVIEGIIPFTD